MTFKFIFVLLCLLYSMAALSAEPLRIDLGDRVARGSIHAPKGEGPRPILILISGETSEPLYAKIAPAAVTMGFTTLELEWSFKKENGKPSGDLKREAEELGAMIDMLSSRMMKRYELDLTKTALIASRTGAKIAMLPESRGAGSKIQAFAILNAPCESTEGFFAKTYAPFIAMKIPRLIFQSGDDCASKQIYAAAKDFAPSISLSISDGELDPKSSQALVMNWLGNRNWVLTKALSKKHPKNH